MQRDEQHRFRVTAAIGLAVACLTLGAPFALMHLGENRWPAVVGGLASTVMLCVHAVLMSRDSPLSRYSVALIAPLGIAYLTYLVHTFGILGMLWCFPGLLGLYCLLPERAAWVANAALLLLVMIVGWSVLEPAVLLRSGATLLAVSLFAGLLLRAVTEQFAAYRFDLAANALYEFVWNEYCDWYLEMAKPVLNGEDDAARDATRRTLLRVLEATLRLAHPIMPFITEALWQQVGPLAGKSGETISLQPWPVADESNIDRDALAEIDWVKQCVMGVRRIRSEMDINPGRRLPLSVAGANAHERRLLGRHDVLLVSLARLDAIDVLDDEAPRPESAVSLVGDMQLLIPMAGLIDKDAELARLGKETSRLEKETLRLSAKLGNAGFTDKAPAAVVDAERTKLAEAETALERLRAQTSRIEAL